VHVLRAGLPVKLALNLIEQPLPSDKAEKRWNETLSVTLRAVTFFDRVERQLDSKQSGVIIERVENGGFAGLAHLREGDLLINLGGEAVPNLNGFERALKDAEKSAVGRLSFLVMRGADTRLLFVDAPWREASEREAMQPKASTGGGKP
jgi:S1-C subfamily serine protease